MFSRFFIDRPIGAAMLSVATVILGLFLLLKLPIAQYPEVVPPTVQVSAIADLPSPRSDRDGAAPHVNRTLTAGPRAGGDRLASGRWPCSGRRRSGWR